MRVEVYAPGDGLRHGPLIGYLLTSDLRECRGRSYELCLDEIEDDIGFFDPTMGMPTINRRWCALRVERRGVRVSERDIASMHWRAHYHIPDYAEESRDMARDLRTFSWPVLMTPDLAIAEAVFDLDIFEPVAGSDSAAAAERFWWRSYEDLLRT